MKTRAAVALAKGKPLEVMDVDVEGPKAGEVLVEIKATGICHTDEFTLTGADPEGLFPAILGHEGAGVVVDVGPGVSSVKSGDHVIPLYTPECRQCPSCLSRKTNHMAHRMRADVGAESLRLSDPLDAVRGVVADVRGIDEVLGGDEERAAHPQRRLEPGERERILE